MAKKEVVDYIERHLEKGYKVHHIRKKLLSVGHKHDDVEEAITEAHNRRYSLRILFVALFLLIIMVLVFIYQDKIFSTEEVKVETSLEEPQESTSSGKVMINIVARDEVEEEVLEEPSECELRCGAEERCVVLCENSEVINEAVSNDDLGVCEKLSIATSNVCKDQIYLRRAVNLDDLLQCNNVQDDFKQTCLDSYYYKKTISSGDLSYCGNIEDKWLKEGCLGVN